MDLQRPANGFTCCASKGVTESKGEISRIAADTIAVRVSKRCHAGIPWDLLAVFEFDDGAPPGIMTLVTKSQLTAPRELPGGASLQAFDAAGLTFQ